MTGVHVNTIRFYEEIGFITKPERDPNGYRVYTPLQLAQCRLVRLAMKAEVLQNGLRKKAVAIIRRCAALDYDASLAAAEEYRQMIDTEIQNAKRAVATVEALLKKEAPREGGALKRRDAAKTLCVTAETLRVWERNGLLSVKRRENGYRVYNAADMDRLNIIRTLRCAGFSLAAVLRLLNGLEQDREMTLRGGESSLENRSVEALLNTPDAQEEILSVCDRLILSLQSTAADAQALWEMLGEIKDKFSTLQ